MDVATQQGSGQPKSKDEAQDLFHSISYTGKVDGLSTRRIADLKTPSAYITFCSSRGLTR